MIELGADSNELEFVSACVFTGFMGAQELAGGVIFSRAAFDRAKVQLREKEYELESLLAGKFIVESEIIYRSGLSKAEIREMVRVGDLVAVTWMRKTYYLLESVEMAALELGDF